MKASLKWLDDPQVFRVGRLDAHSDHIAYESQEDFENRKRVLYQSLNGMWDFIWSPNAKERPKKFYEMEYGREGFEQIQVPWHMELAGYDRVHYINTMYPWEGHVYRRPAEDGDAQPGAFSKADYNPVGSYVKYFDLDEGLRGKRVCISFAGVEQAFYVWLNGSFVGYAEDSFTPSDFDLTPHIRNTGNKLAVEVHKRSTAAYLEDQDFFRFSGIFRDVTLYAKPELHVEDLWAKPELNQDCASGSFSLNLKLSLDTQRYDGQEVQEADRAAEVQAQAAGAGGKKTRGKGANAGRKSWADYQVYYSLTDEGGKRILEGRMPAGEQVQFASAALEQVTAWDNHRPYLYHLLVELQDTAGRLIELVPYRIGFRRIELVDKVMYLNGSRLILNGVNRHEWNARSGRVITMDDMLWDIGCLKQNHINAVRTCHYPDQIPWYALCDASGIYLMSETNLESHGSWQKMGAVEPSWNVPGSNPAWLGAVLDRAQSNFETFKNHVSVLFWSLGNESYAGDCLVAMNAYFKEMDPSRLVHYEGVFHNRAYEDRISDMESQMYAPPERIRAYLEDHPKKPFILCEYMHDMGNSLGGLGSYMQLLDEYEMYQGGFIWDYIDQALLVQDDVTGREVLRYGGDFDDRPSDYEFSGNGIVFADRQEKPAMQEVRYYYGLKK